MGICILLAACAQTGTIQEETEALQAADRFLQALRDRDIVALRLSTTDDFTLNHHQYGLADDEQDDPWDLASIESLFAELDWQLDELAFAAPLDWVDGSVVTSVGADKGSASVVGRLEASFSASPWLGPSGTQHWMTWTNQFIGSLELVRLQETWLVSEFQLLPIPVDAANPPRLTFLPYLALTDDHPFGPDHESLFCWGWQNEGGTGWMRIETNLMKVGASEPVWEYAAEFWVGAGERFERWSCDFSLHLPFDEMEAGEYRISVDLYDGLDVESLQFRESGGITFTVSEEHVQGVKARSDGQAGVKATVDRLLNALADYDGEKLSQVTTEDFHLYFLDYQVYDDAYYAGELKDEDVWGWDRASLLELLGQGLDADFFAPLIWVDETVAIEIDEAAEIASVEGHVYIWRIGEGVYHPATDVVTQDWGHKYWAVFELTRAGDEWLVREYGLLPVFRDASSPPELTLLSEFSSTSGSEWLSPSDQALVCWGWDNLGGTGSVGFEVDVYHDGQLIDEEFNQFWVAAWEVVEWWDCKIFPAWGELEAGEGLKPGEYTVEVRLYAGLDEFSLEQVQSTVKGFTVLSD